MIGIANHTTVDVIEFPDQPEKIGKQSTQLLYGESFNIEREEGDYYYGTCTHDDYAGYALKSQVKPLKENEKPPSDLIYVPSTHLYAKPSFKTQPILSLSYLSRLSVTQEQKGDFTKVDNGKWIFTNHIKSLSNFPYKLDTIELAKSFLGTPYLYAGRSVFGIDCAGLIQILMMAQGYSYPARDCCDQETTLGEAVSHDDIQAGDIVYFEGHVGLMIDDKHILNATSRHMTTLIENLSDLERIYNGIRHVRRVD